MAQASLSSKARGRLILRGVVAPVFILALLFLAAGRWDYWQGWVYLGLNTAIVLLMSLALTKDTAFVEERLSPGPGTKDWDRLYFALTTPLYFLALLLGGLDARFGWTGDLPLPVYLAGLAVYLLGQAIFLWARHTNQYFSSVVRIQADRGQTVCRDGPYRYVRHPGYVGGILFTVSTGLVLGSAWAGLPQILASALLIWRTVREDATLLAELPGYAEYAAETRRRLVPGVW